MIKVNLLPGGKKGRGGGFSLSSLSLPSFGGGGGSLDRFVLGAAAAVVLALAGAGYTWVSTSGQLEELDVRLAAELEDSTRFASMLARTDELTARRDSILRRIAVIQEIDQGRYTWSHIFDEVARALPDYTWLTSLTEMSEFPNFELLIEGASGDLTAMTAFMGRLEASPFFRDVRVITSALQVEQPGTAQEEQFYLWQLQLFYELPDDQYVETVPLFDDQAGPEAGSSGVAQSTDSDVAPTDAPESGSSGAEGDA